MIFEEDNTKNTTYTHTHEWLMSYLSQECATNFTRDFDTRMKDTCVLYLKSISFESIGSYRQTEKREREEKCTVIFVKYSEILVAG